MASLSFGSAPSYRLSLQASESPFLRTSSTHYLLKPKNLDPRLWQADAQSGPIAGSPPSSLAWFPTFGLSSACFGRLSHQVLGSRRTSLTAGNSWWHLIGYMHCCSVDMDPWSGCFLYKFIGQRTATTWPPMPALGGVQGCLQGPLTNLLVCHPSHRLGSAEVRGKEGGFEAQHNLGGAGIAHRYQVMVAWDISACSCTL